MKPICVPCQRFFRMKKAGYYFIEGMPRHNNVRPGKIDAELWKPYKIWVGDLWECQGCHAQIVSGFGNAPLSERHKNDFDEIRNRTGADRLQVNDC